MADHQIDRSSNSSSDLFNYTSSFSRINSISTDTQIERVSSPISAYGFKAGDLVWGKVKSHPWWPGHVFNESFASPSVRRTKSKGLLLVAFFGDSSYGWFDPSELIPYEPNFVEKSKQTIQKTFIKAIEESIDEMSRRVALGLSCRCRNPLNFMSIRVENYYEVDVTGYERNGIYSEEQILKERKWFDKKNVLGFVRNVAVWNIDIDNDSKDVHWYRNVAAIVALRNGRYEEFDETYAQAFGQEPVRPARKKMGVLEEMESFGPRVAPLQGSLLIAENLGNKKKKAITKQLPSTCTSTLPHHSTIPKEKKKKKNDNFFLKKREQPSPSPSPPLADSSSFNLSHHENDIMLQNRGEEPNKQETKPDKEQILSTQENTVKKAKKIKKRSLDQIDHSNEEAKSAEKKKIKVDIEPTQNASSFSSPPSKNPIPPTFHFPSPPPNIDITQVKIQTVLADFTSLAANPFYQIDPDALSIIRYALTRFRLLVYSKRPFLLENDVQEHELVEAPKSTVTLPVEDKPIPLNEPAKSGQKRAPSDPPKERPEKKSKVRKTGDSSSTAAVESTAVKKPMKKPENAAVEPTAVKKPENAVVEPTAVKKQLKKPEKKKEEAPPPMPENPTYLIMKFPRSVTLPSVANLKARFVAFGNIIPESTRVYWKTHTCKVLFREKKDAVKAYVTCKDGGGFFGNAAVNYSIHEVELPAPPPVVQRPPPPVVQRPPPEPMGRPVNSPPGLPRLISADPPRSILKKRGVDEGKVQRVTFADSSNNSPRVVNSPPRSPPPPPPPRNPNALHDPRRALAPNSTRVQSIRVSEAQPLPAAAAPPVQEGKGEADVMSRMYGLLLRIDTVVGRIRTLPGYTPYGPL